MTFGERLYKLRQQANLSQEEFAEIMDVSRQSISKWENDKAYPEMTRLVYMSDFFQVSLDYLMRGVEAEEQKNSKADEKMEYKAKSLIMIWNTFITNLTGMQKVMFIGFYILLSVFLICMIVAFFYGMGNVIGHVMYEITH